jgi:hypothetical protein
MNAAQQALIEKTLAVIGYIALPLGALILLSGLNSHWDLDDLFDADEAAWMVWPPLIIGSASLWVRAFLRAARKN